MSTNHDPHNDWGDVNPAQIRAFLDHDEWLESLTDEQRAIRAKRMAILGGSDEAHALNRSER